MSQVPALAEAFVSKPKHPGTCDDTVGVLPCAGVQVQYLIVVEEKSKVLKVLSKGCTYVTHTDPYLLLYRRMC